MTGFVATRNTCFALIAAIEEDFRNLLIALNDDSAAGLKIFPTDVEDAAMRRRASDNQFQEIASATDMAELLPYIDFADISKILDKNHSEKNSPHYDWITKTSRELASLAAARNRVCHSRPLETEDLPNLIDFSDRLLANKSFFEFPAVRNARNRLSQEPSFVLTLQIPNFWVERSRIHNNLPIPEFDDTGFVGRQTDRQHVIRLLRSHYPIVTIVGEGGVGKTALALRCLYDIIDDGQSGYDAIIWVSLKTSLLTISGVRNITGAITSTLGLFSEVARNFGSTLDPEKNTEQEFINEIAEYLSLYKIIIAIDNLETISTGPLRELLLKVPAQSKILLTSRVGIGEFEARYPLQGLEERAAVSLFRTYSKILAVQAVIKFDNGSIIGFCRRLFFNPLLIKWFVASVARGSEPESLMRKGGSTFADALSFCFQNLFDKFANSERSVIACLASARKPLTSAELHFLMPNVHGLEIEVALSSLHNSSIVLRNKQGADGFEYVLSESASTFIGRNAPPDKVFFKAVQDRLRELRQVLTQESILQSRYEYDPYVVRCGQSRDERLCATYLRQALDYARRGDFKPARNSLEEAKRLAPQSGEVWRISALVEQKADEDYQAFEDFSHAVELDPKSAITHYCFGTFLMNEMDDHEGAFENFNLAERLDPEAAPILTAKAMALSRLGKFEDAARIHESLLVKIESRERRWRITGADQAADCYRRYAYRSWEHKEFDKAEASLKRALSILLEAANRGDFDIKLNKRTGKVIAEALMKRELCANVEFMDAFTDMALEIAKTTRIDGIPIFTEIHVNRRDFEVTQSARRKLATLDKNIYNHESQGNFDIQNASRATAASDLIDSQRYFGEIHNTTLRQRYGFIISNMQRFFFHESSLLQGTTFDMLEPGVRVEYSIGQNAKGLCAIAVKRVGGI